jgi:hypothetical protein
VQLSSPPEMSPISRLLSALAAVFGAIVLIAPTLANASPDAFNYQVAFPQPPADTATAISTLSERAKAFADFAACGAEIEFLRPDNPEGLLQRIIGKMVWLSKGGTICHAVVRYRPKALFPNQFGALGTDYGFLQAGGASLNQTMINQFGNGCTTDEIVHTSEVADSIEVNYEVTRDCIISQINSMLLKLQRAGQIGSSGDPCFLATQGPLSGVSTGDWDVAVRSACELINCGWNAGSRRSWLPTSSVIRA